MLIVYWMLMFLFFYYWFQPCVGTLLDNFSVILSWFLTQDFTPTFLRIQVLEVRPIIDWNKGKAVEFLLESLGEFAHCKYPEWHRCSNSIILILYHKSFVPKRCGGTGLSNGDDVLPFYIGDDRTDEDAFKVLKCLVLNDIFYFLCTILIFWSDLRCYGRGIGGTVFWCPPHRKKPMHFTLLEIQQRYLCFYFAVVFVEIVSSLFSFAFLLWFR